MGVRIVVGAMMPVPVNVPSDDSVADSMLPPIAAALDGGAPIIPLPEGPSPIRESLIASLRPDLPAEDGVALIVPTSGSTGEAKGTLLSSSALLTGATATHGRLGGTGTWLLALPPTHVAGLMVLVRSVAAGTTPKAVDLSGGFTPDKFAAACDELFAGSPGRAYTALVARQLADIVEAKGAALDVLARFDAVLLGGSAIPHALVREAKAAGVHVVATYGMTETCGGCVYDGRPLDGVRVDTGDDGVVRIAGPTLATGYRLRPDLTEAAFVDGWFRTADLGSIGSDGLLTVNGRSDDVAISGGVNVPLVAVDLVVGSHPDVRYAGAVAVADTAWGQRIVAVIVPADPGRPPSLESIRSYVKDRAPAAYAPQEVVVIDAIPTTPSGKPDRRALAGMI